MWCKDLHHLLFPSVSLERAGSATREQQVFPVPIPKYVLRIIVYDLPRVIGNDRFLIDTDREKM